MEVCDGWMMIEVWVYIEGMYATVCDEHFSLASDRLLFWPRS